ncbi:contractile injection system protein, VgrG/Pvc8 family [Marinomonas gallaica]|uniref:contractile injection system protein, VgrG/Pvc8 family n=1 Tax=Marinomonas gallaica TaxID=1806667 RepID=UPI0009F2BB5A|nr:contractile injection system protein, VgrG/Pvc8 family [Marinomonas gallaica]
MSPGDQENYRLSLTGDHPKREYTVQYNETDFNFLSRLFEEEGIFYYFEHKASQYKLVISENTGGYGQCEEASVDYRAGTASAHTEFRPAFSRSSLTYDSLYQTTFYIQPISIFLS